MARLSGFAHAVGVVLAYGLLASLFLGGGIALRAVTIARADEAPAARASAASPETTETTWRFETTTTTILFRASATTVPARRAAPPVPAGPIVAAASVPTDRLAVWLRLADCESGVWGAGKVPVPGSANWGVVDEVHQGGLQIRAGQWDQHKLAGFPEDANLATPEQQIAVGEIILAGQGVKAWPTCGPRIGLDRLV